jgi:hypothetical protein
MARVLARGRKVEFCDSDFLGVLKAARDRIHLGHELLTHPLSGSVKPWETPYKTIVLSDAKGALDEKGLSVIEESIQACIRLKPKAAREWSEKTLADFRLIDYNLVFGHTGELQ